MIRSPKKKHHFIQKSHLLVRKHPALGSTRENHPASLGASPSLVPFGETASVKERFINSRRYSIIEARGGRDTRVGVRRVAAKTNCNITSGGGGDNGARLEKKKKGGKKEKERKKETGAAECTRRASAVSVATTVSAGR